MAYVLAHFLRYLGAGGGRAAVEAAFWLWLGFIATVTLGGVLWEGKPWKLWIFNNGYQLISLAVMAVILVKWR